MCKIIERGIIMRAGRDRRPAERYGLVMRWARRQMSSICRRWMCMPLTKTASGPGEIRFRRGFHVFVDETDFPMFRQYCRDDQKTLRWHAGLGPEGQAIGMFEGRERCRIAWKHAKDAPRGAIGDLGHDLTPAHVPLEQPVEVSKSTCFRVRPHHQPSKFGEGPKRGVRSSGALERIFFPTKDGRFDGASRVGRSLQSVSLVHSRGGSELASRCKRMDLATAKC